MWNERLLYSRAARTRLRGLPAELRLSLETHLENLALLVKATPPERLPQLLARDEESFVTEVSGARVSFVVNTVTRTLLVHRIDVSEGQWESTSESILSTHPGERSVR